MSYNVPEQKIEAESEEFRNQVNEEKQELQRQFSSASKKVEEETPGDIKKKEQMSRPLLEGPDSDEDEEARPTVNKRVTLKINED